MDCGELQEVIFEAWVYQYQGHEGRHTLRLSSRWKRRYIILLRYDKHACVQYYEKKPETLEDNPKGRIYLSSWFMVKKRPEYQGRNNVCEVITASSKILLLSTEEEKIFHLLAFFLQTQIKLREESEAACFVVRPDGSDDHMKLGSRGSMCLLHVSKGGITLALQLSRCVLTQWPLSCIKLYDGEIRGQFMIETGNNAPTGAGKFVFNTRLEQNKTIYDLLDAYVMELAGLKQMALQRTSAQSDTLENVIAQQYDALQELVQPESDPRFIPHLKKVSRGIYDQLAEHLGATSHSRLDVSTSDPISSSGPPMMKFVPKRSASQHSNSSQNKPNSENFDFLSLGHRPRMPRPKPPSHLALKHESLPEPRIKSKESREVSQTTSARAGPGPVGSMPQGSFYAQYLHMSPAEATGPSGSMDQDVYVTTDNPPSACYNNISDPGISCEKSEQHHSRISQGTKCTEMSADASSGFAKDGLSGATSHTVCDPRRLTFDGYSLASESLKKSIPGNNSWTSSLPDTNANDCSSCKVTTVRKNIYDNQMPFNPNSVYQDMSGSPPNIQTVKSDLSVIRQAQNGSNKVKHLERQLSWSSEDIASITAKLSTEHGGFYGNHGLLLKRQHSHSCEDLSREGQMNSKQHPSYSNLEVSGTRKMSSPQELIGNHQKDLLQRSHSRSCENVTEYSQIAHDQILYENDELCASSLSTSQKSPDQQYSYVTAGDVTSDGGIAYSQMLRDKSAFYTRVIPKEFRRSHSAANMVTTDMISANELSPPANKTGNGIKKANNRPTKFDFNKLHRSPSKESPANGSLVSGSPASSSPASGCYTQVGKSKFWNVSLDESPSKIVSATAIKGINMTKETRVFSRRVSNESQQFGLSSVSESNDNIDGGSVSLRRADLSSGSMRGRRLPSLPADAELVVSGLNVEDTKC